MISKRRFKFRLTTTSAPNGESLTIRILEPWAKPKNIGQLGMTEDLVRVVKDFATRRHRRHPYSRKQVMARQAMEQLRAEGALQ